MKPYTETRPQLNLIAFRSEQDLVEKLDVSSGIDIYYTNATCTEFSSLGDGSALTSAEASIMMNNAIGGVTFSLSNKVSLTDVFARYSLEKISPTSDTVITINAKDKTLKSDFSRWIQSRLIESSSNIAIELAGLHRALFTMRKEHEQTQVAFAALDSFVARNIPTPYVITFTAEPTDQYFDPFLISSQRPTVEQLLPQPSTRLSAFELFFKKVSLPGSGNIHVELISAETHRVFAIWIIGFADINDGWNTFLLDRTHSGTPESVKIRVHWDIATDMEKTPLIALSLFNPLPEYRLKSNGSTVTLSLRSLAFRCRESLPGLRPPKLLGAILPIRERVAASEMDNIPWRSQPIQFQNAKEVGRTRQSRGPNLVVALDDASRLMVHPKSMGISAAILEEVCPPQIERITATVLTENSQASEVLYGIAIVAATERFKREITESDIMALGSDFSGWYAVKPAEKIQLQLCLQTATSQNTSLVLMTKLNANGNVENAWSTFHSIECFPVTPTAKA